MNKLCECGCGQPVKWSVGKFLRGHHNRSLDVKEKKRLTSIKNYGTDHPMQTRQIQDKYHKTMIDKYGVEHAHQSKELRSKYTKTMIDKYNVTNPMKSKIFQNQSKLTMIQNYGVEHALQSKEIQEKFKKTCLDRFGVESSNQSEEIKLKKIKTSLNHFGVSNPLQSKEIQEKIKKTCLEQFGTENPFSSKEIQEKIKKTCLEQFGTENPFSSKEIQEKIKNIMIDKFGVDNYSKTSEGKRILRVNSINRREDQRANNEPDMPVVGIQERPFLNELQLLVPQYKILRQDPSFKRSIGRTPDGYIKELDLIILFNERFHYLDKRTCLIPDADTVLTIEDFKGAGMNVFTVSQQQWENEKENIISEFKTLVSSLSQTLETSQDLHEVPLQTS